MHLPIDFDRRYAANLSLHLLGYAPAALTCPYGVRVCGNHGLRRGDHLPLEKVELQRGGLEQPLASKTLGSEHLKCGELGANEFSLRVNEGRLESFQLHRPKLRTDHIAPLRLSRKLWLQAQLAFS